MLTDLTEDPGVEVLLGQLLTTALGAQLYQPMFLPHNMETVVGQARIILWALVLVKNAGLEQEAAA
jgi:hypothetical protein